MSIEAMRQALDELERLQPIMANGLLEQRQLDFIDPHVDRAITTLRAAIKQAEIDRDIAALREAIDQLEDHPRRDWQGLTADEIWQCNTTPPGSEVGYHICMAHQNVLDFAEAIEAKLKEKNT